MTSLSGQSLLGQSLSDVYCGLIKTSNSCPLPSSKIVLTDGEGTVSSLAIGQKESGIKVFGTINSTQSIITLEDVCACNDIYGNKVVSPILSASNLTVSNNLFANEGNTYVKNISGNNSIYNSVNANTVKVTERYISNVHTQTVNNNQIQLDFSKANLFRIDLNFNGDVQLLEPINALPGSYTISIKKVGNNFTNIVPSSAYKFPEGIFTGLDQSNNSINIINIIYDGENYYSTLIQNFI